MSSRTAMRTAGIALAALFLTFAYAGRGAAQT